jgi:hypothetical protein
VLIVGADVTGAERSSSTRDVANRSAIDTSLEFSENKSYEV